MHCGKSVDGDGYTNHCPHCLWSCHVDIQPGDRAADCGGAMPPIAIEKAGDSYRILHRCAECGFERPNKVQDKDNFSAILALARRLAGV